ncbi:MAG TPA: polyamine ABC transporter substrate-binding protein [Alphaproteobacteria bacterium]|nr:polyamine ABC transporter substrate-binding protein [Alphaproteobacteria bacterium]
MSFRVASLVAAAAAALFAGGASAQQKTLNIYNWSDYIGETTIADFEKETGIKVNYDVYDGNETLEAKLLAGKAGYDLVVPSSQPFLSRQIKAKVYQKLDKSKIPNLKNLDPELMRAVQGADPNNEHAVIYQWGTDGLGYNVDKVKQLLGENAPLDSYDLLFKKENVEKLASCGVTILDAPTDVLPIALNYLGLDPNSEKAEDLAKAEALIMSIRPYVKYFHSSQYINDLANGDICLALGYSGDILQAQARAVEAKNNVNVAYALPKEGTMMWFDTAAIPADAPNPDAAHQFINFILKPEVMAGISGYVAYANAVPESWKLLPEELRSDPNIFPPEELRRKLFTVKEASQAFERQRTRTWTKIRTGQ